MIPKPIRIKNKKLLEEIRSKPCCICGRSPVDASHIKTRGSGGPDTYFNTVAHCRTHHIEWGQYGPRRFFLRYPVMLFKLQSLGWTWDGQELWHPGLAKQD